MEINKCYNIDCLEGMKNLPDDFVDVSFTSPPYNDRARKVDYLEDGSISREAGRKHTKYKYMEHRKDWFNWQCEVIDEMLRVSKKYVLYNIQAIVTNRQDVYKLIGKYYDRLHDILIWYKPNGCPTGTPNKISNKYEMVLILRCDGVDGVSVNSKNYNNVIVGGVNRNTEYSAIHKAVMSKNFCSEIIREFTSEGDTVLDPFFGLGTTGVCCVEQGRNYIGFEIFEEYALIAEDRIKDALAKRENSLW